MALSSLPKIIIFLNIYPKIYSFPIRPYIFLRIWQKLLRNSINYNMQFGDCVIYTHKRQ